MKASKGDLWAPLGTVVIGLALLLSSARSPAQSQEDCRAPGPLRFKQEKNRFQAMLQDGVWSLRYEFRDSMGKERQVPCQISDKAHRDHKDNLGLFLCTDRELKERKSEGLFACLDGEKIVPLTDSTPKYEAYLKGRGFQKLLGNSVPDYAGLARSTAGTLRNCAEALENEIGGTPNSQGDWLAFFQAMRPDEDEASLKVHPVEEVGSRKKWNAGLLVPTEVLIQNRGDCDSKALAFCTLQRKPEEKWVLFRSVKLDCGLEDPEGHAFLAFENGSLPNRRRFDLKEVLSEGWPVNDGAFEGNVLKIGGLLEYAVMDVTGPGKTAPGELDKAKYGKYVGIPIEAGSH